MILDTLKCVIFSFLLTFQYAMYSRGSDDLGSSSYCAQCVDFSRERVKSLLLPDLNVMCHPPIQNSYCNGRWAPNFTCSCCEASFNFYTSIRTQNLSTATLEMEMVARNGSGVLLTKFASQDSVKQDKTVVPTVINMSGSDMKQIPINICDFTSAILLDLSHNHLSQLRPLSCLEVLHTLDVSYNRLTFIANTTFENMTKLRFIDLSNNLIRDIEPFTFQQSNIHILSLNVENNLLTSVEWSNFLFLKPTCVVSYAYNAISNITNRDRRYPDLKAFKENGERGGLIDLSNNSLSTAPDPDIFDLETKLDFNGILSFGRFVLQLKNNKLFCDCNLYPTWLNALEYAKHYYGVSGKVYEVCCYRPAHMTSICTSTVSNATSRSLLDKFICNSTQHECIAGCHCFYRPSTDTFTINCSSARLGRINDIDFDSFQNRLQTDLRTKFLNAKVHAHFSNNSITQFPVGNYLWKTTLLDLSFNELSQMKSNELQLLHRGAVINITGNPGIKKLPKGIKNLHSLNVKVQGLILKCTCENEMHKWLPSWIQQGGEENRGKLFCDIGERVLDVIDMTTESIDCNDQLSAYFTATLSSMLLVLLIFSSTAAAFQNEIYILYQRCKRVEIVPRAFRYDVYLVVDEENADLMSWVLRQLCPFLEKSGYVCFLPARDMEFGSLREDEIRIKIDESKTYIVIFTRAFTCELDRWIEIQWRSCWHKYKADCSRHFAVVNYDILESGDINYGVLKAMTRLGISIDFTEKKKFYRQLLKEIGSPIYRKWDQNRKIKFNTRLQNISV